MDEVLNPYAPGAGTPPPELAGIDEAISKADKQARALIGGLREHYAHLTKLGDMTVEEITVSMFESTRRLHALMQACLLREIGVETERIESMISTHYGNWRIP